MRREVRRDRLNKGRKGPAFLVIFLMLLLIVAYVYVAYQTVKPDDNIICDGVFVESVDLSGMTEVQAQEAVKQYSDTYLKRTLEVDVNGKTVSATLEELGYRCQTNDYIRQALRIGKGSNPFTNYAQLRDAAAQPIVYQLKYECAEKDIREFVRKPEMQR